jgi:hypothetical protein
MSQEKIKEAVKEAVADALEATLAAQLRAVRRLKGAPQKEKRAKGRSQIDLVYDILLRAGCELHVNDILNRVRKVHGVALDRESIVSALTKRVLRNDRFVRTGRNIFALKPEKGDQR